ncbi:putative zinc finger protein [Apostichopus japonicus]|uniref:Putative zinc finger protein n=1 Tax=Stichopus japonicus TaxID=307972 RepID=A0A2G8LMS2_STIJA|nr:putative zinc finger protein [Apostichopus japonicus]
MDLTGAGACRSLTQHNAGVAFVWSSHIYNGFKTVTTTQPACFVIKTFPKEMWSGYSVTLEAEKSIPVEDVSQDLNHIATNQETTAQQEDRLHKESSPPNTSRVQVRETSSTPTTRVVVGQENTAAHTRTEKMSSILQMSEDEKRKVYDSRKGDAVVDIVHDHDKDKYKRRSALHWFAGWFKSRTGNSRQVDSNASMKRFAIILILGLVGFFTLVVIMTSVGRAAANKDPLLDPLANPNVRLGEKWSEEESGLKHRPTHD